MTDAWHAVTALTESSRRALYEYVQRAGRPVGREEAAEALRIARGLAAFHLDKLVDAGLLRARYEAPADVPRGRGRTPKVYEPVNADLEVTLPERRYALIAEILADAVADAPTQADDAARRHARNRGHDLGSGLLGAGVDLATALADLGFHPESEPGRVLLHNCPFHALATRQTALVCGLNLELVGGLIAGLGAAGCQAHLVPRPGYCCVEVSTPS